MSLLHRSLALRAGDQSASGKHRRERNDLITIRRRLSDQGIAQAGDRDWGIARRRELAEHGAQRRLEIRPVAAVDAEVSRGPADLGRVEIIWRPQREHDYALIFEQVGLLGEEGAQSGGRGEIGRAHV